MRQRKRLIIIRKPFKEAKFYQVWRWKNDKWNLLATCNTLAIAKLLNKTLKKKIKSA